MRPSYVQIDLAAIQHNLRVLRDFIEYTSTAEKNGSPAISSTRAQPRIIAAVKADAYGHGLVPVAQCLLGTPKAGKAGKDAAMFAAGGLPTDAVL